MKSKPSFLVLAVVISLLPVSHCLAQGSLTPPGAPAPTMKTLSQVDPGTPIRQGDLPFTITTPGAYYLAENLSRNPDTGAAITISSSNVTVDLRGFAIEAVAGSGSSASQSAIYVNTSLADNITVKNGHISGPWYGGVYAGSASENMRCVDLTVDGANTFGLRLGTQARLSGCTVDGNDTTSTGVSVAANSIVRDCVVHHCAGPGYNAENGCVVTHSISTQNQGDGFDVANFSVVAHCTSQANNLAGYDLGAGVNVRQSVAAQNQGDGFDVANDSVVSHCTSYGNTLAGFDLGAGINVSNSTASFNEDDGFNASTASIISTCIARNSGQGTSNTDADGFQMNSRVMVLDSFFDLNEGFGINDDSGGTGTIRDNSVVFNTSGGIDISLSGALVTGNHAFFNGNFQYDLTGGDIGPLENAATGTNPNANFD